MALRRKPKLTQEDPVLPRGPHEPLSPEEMAVVEAAMWRTFLGACLLCTITTLFLMFLIAGARSIPPPILVGFPSITLWALIVAVHAHHTLYRLAREVRLALLQKTFMDEATGIFNFTYLSQRLMEEYERIRRYGGTAAVLFVDLDHFKMVNERFGHLAGNVVLREVASALKSQVRACDVFSRIGGDEFMALLPQTGLEQAKIIAERLRQGVEQYHTQLGEEAAVDFVRASIGVAVYPDNGDSMESIVNAADNAVYEAKKLGGNRVHAFTEFLTREAVGDLSRHLVRDKALPRIGNRRGP